MGDFKPVVLAISTRVVHLMNFFNAEEKMAEFLETKKKTESESMMLRNP